ncbi:MAG: type II toxin-antitoxin system VapC family toxin [Gammaproteobacteria bacterium]|nr:type II toxin-antitoxin system VapC family toxin [Gammaproteobacteria bacterium]
MKVLLDTHIIIWAVSEPQRLSTKAQDYITEAEMIYVSAASIWEISIKIQLNKLQLDLATFIQEIENIGIQSLPVTWKHAQLTKDLPLYHKDPFDRILIAQAMSEPLTLLTNDATLPQYSELVRHLDSF